MPRNRRNNEATDESEMSLSERFMRYHLQFAAGKLTTKELFAKTHALLNGEEEEYAEKQKKTEC